MPENAGGENQAAKFIPDTKGHTRREAITIGAAKALELATLTSATTAGVIQAEGVRRQLAHEQATINPATKDYVGTMATSTVVTKAGKELLENNMSRRDTIKDFFLGIAAKYLHSKQAGNTNN